MTYETKTHTVTRTVFTGEPGANLAPAITFTVSFLFIVFLIAIS